MAWDETAGPPSAATQLFDTTLPPGSSTPLLGVDAFVSLALWAKFAAGTAGQRGALSLSWSDPVAVSGAVAGAYASFDPAWSTTETTLYSVPVIAPGLTVKNTGAVSATVTVSGKALQVPRFVQRGDDNGVRTLAVTAGAAGATYYPFAAADGSSPLTRLNGPIQFTLYAGGGATAATPVVLRSESIGANGSVLTTNYAFGGTGGIPWSGSASSATGLYVTINASHPSVPVRWSFNNTNLNNMPATLVLTQL